MHKTAKFLWAAVCAVTIIIAGGTLAYGATARTINLPSTGIVIQDDDRPEITARVARISFIRGDAQIRRAGAEEWERATLNLPIVEGDDIATEDGRIEIQFDNTAHLRLAENSYLRIVTLKDDGIAISLSLGTASAHLTSFDKDVSFLEADAPGTTMAVQRAGTYRIDAGRPGDNEVRVTVTNGGEARIYSENAGFTLKSGRSARIYIDGDNAGEWDTNSASRYNDEFDEWAWDRDLVIARRLKDAYYDKYYDRDIYGADDLNGYGDWVHTVNYGYVWRPSSSAINSYADWSPYRYGHWRWMPPYGWIWVNDEPWGWATYHHGRWFWDAGYWYWSPYGYIRTSHSWWFPALVVINIYNNHVCWYPLPYHHGFHNFNGNHGGNHGGGRLGNNLPPGTGGIKPIPPQTPPRTVKVPLSAVVALATDDFGITTKKIKTAPSAIASALLSQDPKEVRTAVLPDKRKVTRDISADKPAIAVRAVSTKVGAAPRIQSAPLDKELRTKRILDGRTPTVTGGNTGEVKTVPIDTRQPRKTGVIDRPPPTVKPVPPVKQAPVYTPRPTGDVPADPPVKTAPVRVPRDPVRIDPAPTKDTPRYDRPPVKAAPRDTPPVRQAPKSIPSPVRSEPKPESKPSKKPADAPVA